MGLDIDKFNEMINQASKIVSCDSDCQRTKRQELLKKKFAEAQANAQSAPDQLNIASKKYFAFSNGKMMYEKIATDELIVKSKLITSEIASNFLIQSEEAKNSLQDYSSALTDAKIADEYNKELIKQIVQLQNVLYKSINGTVTNHRKSYYESETTANLRKWNYIFIIIFYVLVIALSLSFFLVPNTNSLVKKIVVCVALATYPFYIMYIAIFLGRIYNNAKSTLPSTL
jgi:hypothetical protein